jgi:hypothetical protein
LEGAIAPLSPSSAARFGGIGHVGPTALPHFAYAEQSAEQSAIDNGPSTSDASAGALATNGGKDNSSASCHIDRLPDELLLKICAYLLEGDLCRMTRTGQRMYRICNDTKVW